MNTSNPSDIPSTPSNSQPPSSEESSTPPPPPSSSSAAPPPPSSTSTPTPEPSSSQPPTSQPPSTSAPPPSSSSSPTPTPSSVPTPDPTTILSTQILTVDRSTQTVVQTITAPPPSTTSDPSTISDGAQTTTGGASVQTGTNNNTDSGLSPGGRTAIAVVIPVVAVALLVAGALFWWRRRTQNKNAEEARKQEMEEYGYNPNNDPTLPAVGAAVMTEDSSGYRGWGNTTTTSNRHPSTAPFSDNGSVPGGYQPGSPPHSDGNSVDPLVNGQRHETMDSETVAALGAGPAANQNRGNGVQRGPSNASSSYSAGHNSDGSGEGQAGYENYTDNGYYPDNGYPGPQPIIRDVEARRNTRIENPSVLPQQGNSGISQNF